jgi:hypothetical protein
MKNPDHIFSESLETIFGIKILKFFDADSGSGMEKIRIRDGKIQFRDKHPGFATMLFIKECNVAGCASRRRLSPGVSSVGRAPTSPSMISKSWTPCPGYQLSLNS